MRACPMRTVLLADPTPSLRAALALLLRRRLHVDQIEEAPDLERLDLALARTAPDLLLLDWQLVQPDGQALQRWQRRQPGLKIVAMGLGSGPAAPALQAGASAYIDKSAPPQQALECLTHFLASQP